MNDEFRMSNDELPTGWEAIRLQDIASWGSGGTPPRKNPKFYGGDIPWIKTGELGDGLILDTEEKITADGLKNSSAKVFPKGSVAIAMYGATIGKVSILGIDAATNQACAVGIPDHRLTSPHYIFQYLRSQKEAFIAAGKGGAQPNLSQGVIKEWPFPLAPLAEQKRIVDKLEAVLGRVDTCRARLDRVPALLKRFRQSVLASATSGGLTAEWRMSNGVNAEWETVPLRDTIDGIEQGWSPKCENEPSTNPTDWAVIKTTAIQEMAFLEYENKRLPKHLKPRPNLEIQPGDILITRAGPRVRAAVTCMVESVRPRLIVCDKVYRFRAKKGKTSPNYLNVFLNSPLIVQKLDEMKTGISDSGVNLTQSKFSALQVSLPTLPEQQEIVRRVGDLFAFADRIEDRLATAQKTVERLTPATLAKAFRGELVPQDPNDEPASALLNRLRT